MRLLDRLVMPLQWKYTLVILFRISRRLFLLTSDPRSKSHQLCVPVLYEYLCSCPSEGSITKEVCEKRLHISEKYLYVSTECNSTDCDNSQSYVMCVLQKNLCGKKAQLPQDCVHLSRGRVFML